MRFLLFSLLTFGFFSCEIPGNYENKDSQPPSPKQLLLDLTDNGRFLSVDQVADRIVNQDPGLMLVDVRSHEEYDRYTLPGAVNIPLPGILDENNLAQLDCDRYSILFFSNGDVHAEQAWVINRRRGCEDVYIMRGGLNDWAEKILNPQEPPQTESAEAWEKYQFRKAAAQFFIGQSKPLQPEPYVQPVVVKPSPKKIEVKPKKKVVVEEEGC